MLYRAPVDTSPVTEAVTLFKYQLLLLLLLLLALNLSLQDFIRKNLKNKQKECI